MTKGFPKEKRVTWDAVTADQVKDYHSFTVTGHVEGVEKEAQAQVTVEGIIAVEKVSTTTPVGENQPFQKACGLITPMARPMLPRWPGMRSIRNS